MLYNYETEEFEEITDIIYNIPLDRLFKLNSFSFFLLENEEEENSDNE